MSIAITITDAGKNALLGGGWKNVATYVAATDGAPNATHTSIGTRGAISWGTPAAGVLTQSNSAIVSAIAAGSDVTHLAYYTASTGGDLLGFAALPSTQTFATAGSYQVVNSTVTVSIPA